MHDLTLQNVVRRTRALDLERPPSIGDLKFQYFPIVLKNNGGVIQHAFTLDGFGDSAKGPWPLVSDKFRNIAPLGAYTNTPTLGAGQGFVAGAGIFNQLIVFDTEPLDPNALRPADHCVLQYYQGNNTRVLAMAGFVSVNVLGVTIPRFCIGIWNYVSGVAVNITTTWLGASGNIAAFVYWGYL